MRVRAGLHAVAPRVRRGIVFLFLLVAAAFGGCVSLVAQYDEVLDRSATETQKKVALLFAHLQSSDPGERSYRSNQGAYDEVFADLHVLKTRAEANNESGRNAATIAQIDSIRVSVEEVRDQHQSRPGGLSAAYLDVAHDAIDLQFQSMLQLEFAKKRGA